MKIIIAEVIGTIALIISVIVYQKNDRKSMLYLQGIACGVFFFQYFLLGAWTGAIMNLLNVFRNYVFASKGSKSWANSKLWLYIFIFLYIISTILTWQGWISLMPLFGMLTNTIAFWLRNTTHIRVISLTSPPFWFTYNFISKAYPAMICDIMAFVSIIVGIVRFDIKNNKVLVNEDNITN
jgi:hypothetical protein